MSLHLIKTRLIFKSKITPNLNISARMRIRSKSRDFEAGQKKLAVVPIIRVKFIRPIKSFVRSVLDNYLYKKCLA